MRIFAQAPGSIIRRGNAKSLAASELRTLCNPPCPLKKTSFPGSWGPQLFFSGSGSLEKGWERLEKPSPLAGSAGCPVSVSQRLSSSSHHLSPEHKWRAEVKLSSKVRIKRRKNKNKNKKKTTKQPTLSETREGEGLAGKSYSRSELWQNSVPRGWIKQQPIWEWNENKLLRSRAKTPFCRGERKQDESIHGVFGGSTIKALRPIYS